MIQNTQSLGTDQTVVETKFQRDLLEHWHSIQTDRKYPDKKAFRPQKFPKFLPQLAIVSIEGGHFDDRLTGATVSEVLRLSGSSDTLVAPRDENIRTVMTNILVDAFKATGPIYFKGELTPTGRSPVDFTALVLPFSKLALDEVPDTLMLAFDFSRRTSDDNIPQYHTAL